jgi:hypothetical protein
VVSSEGSFPSSERPPAQWKDFGGRAPGACDCHSGPGIAGRGTMVLPRPQFGRTNDPVFRREVLEPVTK